MGELSNFYDVMGLPTPDYRNAALERMREHFDDSMAPWRKADAWWEKFGDRTGIPTYHDVFAGTEGLREWVQEHYPDAVDGDGDEDETEDDEGDEDGDALRRWLWRLGLGAAFVYYVYKKLDYKVGVSEDVSEDIPGFEVDGFPWTVDKIHKPGPPMAARVGDPMLHGGTAIPGPGSKNVKISGGRALTRAHAVTCPMTNVVGLPHLPGTGPEAWMAWNNTVFVNGAPLLRAGDWTVEHFGGNNPIIAGAPTVIAGPVAQPCVVQEVEYLGLPGGIERMGTLGGKYTFKGSVSWNARDIAGALVAAGLVALGDALPPIAPVAFGAARMLLGAIDGPTLEMEITVEETFFIETRTELDPNDDGIIDQIVLTRVTTKVTGKSTHSVVLDPKKPGHAKKSEEGPFEVDTESDVQWQFLDPDEARKPWKDQ